MSRRVQIGFNQRVQLEWLERTAALYLGGSRKERILADLRGYLSDQISVGGNAERSNREKAITILMKTWVTVPRRLAPFRDEGLGFLQRLPLEERLPVHWGMAMAAYPFFGSVAETVGRLLRLQGKVAARQAQRRVREQLGERETVARATRRVLRCFIDWGVLEDREGQGVYAAPGTRAIKDPALAGWLMEAVLRAAEADTAPVQALAQSPALFPFALARVNGLALRDNERVEVIRQALDEEYVMLRRSEQRKLL